MAAPSLTKLTETVAVFLRDAPSPRELLASRHPSFDRLHAILPSTVETGERAAMTVQAWDGYERIYDEFGGSVALDSTDPAAALPDRLAFDADGASVLSVEGVAFETPGVQYVTLTHEATGRRFVSNPVEVHETAPDRRIFWGDIHLHSLLSDGVGSMEKGLRFGRDVMDLDVCAYTDHDTMGFFIPPRLQRRRMRRRYFDRIKATTEAFHEPGEFVTLFGYEYTNQPDRGGHVNVYFDCVEEAELIDSIAPESDTFEKLWARLREWRERTGRDVVAFPHHPAEEMYPFDFSSIAYDDELAPVVEVYSQWGNSERPGAEGNPYPLGIGRGQINEPGHFAQDALELGYRVGLTASSDFHGPRPGHSLIHAPAHLPSRPEWREDGVGWGNIWRVWDETSYPGGLAAFYAPELTREAIFEALRSRKVYGTIQPHRILVRFSIEGVRVGEADSTVTVPDATATRAGEVSVAGTAPLERVTVVKNSDPWRRFEGTDDPDADLDAYTLTREFADDEPVTGVRWRDGRGTDDDVYYLRVTQADGGMAWAGPLWVRVAD